METPTPEVGDNTKTIIITVVSVIIANWTAVAPMLKFIVVNAWEKSVQWRDMVRDLADVIADVEKLKTDVTAAHSKIRVLETKLKEKERQQ